MTTQTKFEKQSNKNSIQSQQDTPIMVIEKDDDQRLVFGWASIIEEGGAPVIDSDGSIIEEAELEKGAYNFVLNARIAGEMHIRKGVGRLVESIVFTKEKQNLLGVNLGKTGWFVGFKIDDDDVWKKYKNGEYSSFSIGGRGQIESVAE